VTPPAIAVVGSGPAGIFVVESLLKTHPDARIDVIERLPAPYGLLRYGVAPDHLKMKSLATGFARTLSNPRVRFFGNVEIGRDIDVADLRSHYDAIVYAIGAPSHRSLGIPGEDLPGSLPAGDFVAWYGGHPESLTPPVDLTGASSAAVVGVGNVAIDTARVLLKDTSLLEVTDMSRETLAVLAASNVSDVYMLGRRGAHDAKFTTKELRELGELPGVDVVIEARDLAGMDGTEYDGLTQRNLEVLREFAARPLTGAPRRLHLRFYARPVEIVGPSHVEALRIERMRYDDAGALGGTGVFEDLPVQIVFRAVGYRSVMLAGVPFDEKRGLVPNAAGRVLDGPDGAVRPGEYVAGWVKRGPQGVIGTNKQDAAETVAALVADLAATDAERTSHPDLAVTLAAYGISFVDWEGWSRIDARERELGAAEGRDRIKISAIEHLLEAANERPLLDASRSV
jgi:ferredoxin--NADP+ reductase